MNISQFNCEPITVEKNRLFFNQYHYSGKFYLSDLGVIRGLEYDRIDSIVAYRNSARSLSVTFRPDRIDDSNVEHLKTLCRILQHYKDQLKFVVSYNCGHVYTNNLTVLKTIHDLDFVRAFSLQQVNVISDADVIMLNNPGWAYRTYFRSHTLSEHQREVLVDYLAARENIKLSRGLQTWCQRPKHRWWDLLLQSYFFIDHNDIGEVTFLNLVVPRITNRTFRLVAK